MGLFDTIRCEYPLPDPSHQDLEYQTKDLDRAMLHYTITADGRLVRHPWRRGEDGQRDLELLAHGEIAIYTHDDTPEKKWVEYLVRFTHGRVEWIQALTEEQERERPAAELWLLPADLLEPFWLRASLAVPAGGEAASLEAPAEPVAERLRG